MAGTEDGHAHCPSTHKAVAREYESGVSEWLKLITGIPSYRVPDVGINMLA